MKTHPLSFPYVRVILDLLEDNGVDARLVGGAVRDHLLGLPIGDIDIAAGASPKEVTELLTPHCQVIPTGIHHGTVTAVMDHVSFQVTSLREDIKTDGRYATVIYGTSFEKDAARRDFTFNALYMDRFGDIYDYFGGKDDLDAGRVRFIGDATTRIREDCLRILRFFRMYAYFGRGDADHEALLACELEKSGIQNLSKERIRHEFLKILDAPQSHKTIVLMEKTGVLREIYPHTPDLQAFDRLSAHGGAIVGLLTLYHGAIEDLTKSFVLTKKESYLLKNFLTYKKTFFEKTPEELLYKLGVDVFEQILKVLGAIHHIEIAPSLNVSKNWVRPQFPVSAEDLPFLSGKDLGDALKATEEFWIQNGFKADKEECLAFLKK